MCCILLISFIYEVGAEGLRTVTSVTLCHLVKLTCMKWVRQNMAYTGFLYKSVYFLSEVEYCVLEFDAVQFGVMLFTVWSTCTTLSEKCAMSILRVKMRGTIKIDYILSFSASILLWSVFIYYMPNVHVHFTVVCYFKIYKELLN